MTPFRSSRDGSRNRPDRRSRPSAPRKPATQRRDPAPSDPDRVLARQPWAALRPLLAGVGDVEATIAQLREYTRQLLEWNRGVSNLVSRNDEMRLVERHIAESLAPVARMREAGCRKLLDLGSGAGLPAIPLAIAGIGEKWTLVESRRNKTLFMRKALSDMKMEHIEVACSRLETLIDEPEFLADFDGFTSRATMAVGPTLELATHVVVHGGRAFLWKGSGFEDERLASESDWSHDWTFEDATTILEGPNCLAVFVRK